MVSASGGKAAERIGQIADMGFESFEPFFWQTTNSQDLADLGKRCVEAIGDRDITISTLGMFGNPLEETDMDLQTLQGWKDCIDNAHHFGATCVAGFTGRVRGKPLTESLPAYRTLWSELARRAADKGVRIQAVLPGATATEFWDNGGLPLGHLDPAIVMPASALVDAALIDIMMPEMDGYETMRRIRSSEHIAAIPLIAVTAKAMKGDRQKCLDAGASDYIAKPVDIDMLLALLRVTTERTRIGKPHQKRRARAAA